MKLILITDLIYSKIRHPKYTINIIAILNVLFLI
ncbi:MAG: hypothetical protein KHZ99_13865 [Clostridium sp.]|nr:hypothetical protein [Clostridium sp.]